MTPGEETFKKSPGKEVKKLLVLQVPAGEASLAEGEGFSSQDKAGQKGFGIFVLHCLGDFLALPSASKEAPPPPQKNLVLGEDTQDKPSLLPWEFLLPKLLESSPGALAAKPLLFLDARSKLAGVEINPKGRRVEALPGETWEGGVPEEAKVEGKAFPVPGETGNKKGEQGQGEAPVREGKKEAILPGERSVWPVKSLVQTSTLNEKDAGLRSGKAIPALLIQTVTQEKDTDLRLAEREVILESRSVEALPGEAWEGGVPEEAKVEGKAFPVPGETGNKKGEQGQGEAPVREGKKEAILPGEKEGVFLAKLGRARNEEEQVPLGKGSPQESSRPAFLSSIWPREKLPSSQGLERGSLVEKISAEIVSRVRILLQEGGGELELELEPTFLGSLRVSVGTKEGILEVKLLVANQEVRYWLQSQLPQLKEAFQQQGINVASFEVGNYFSPGGQSGLSPSPESFSLFTCLGGKEAKPRKGEKSSPCQGNHRINCLV